MFSENLRKLRESAGLSQADLVKKLDITRSTYSNYENGNRSPGLKILKKIADFYGVPIDELTGDSAEIPESFFRTKKYVRRFKATGKMQFSELPLTEIGIDEHYTLTQIKEVYKSMDYVTIHRGIAIHEVPADVVPEKDFNVYRISYMIPGPASVVKFIHENEMVDIVKENLRDFLAGNAARIFRDYFEKEG